MRTQTDVKARWVEDAVQFRCEYRGINRLATDSSLRAV